MPAVSEESALTESGNPGCGLRGWTFSNDHGKCPTPMRRLLVPDTCLHVRLLGIKNLNDRCLLSSTCPTPPAGTHPTCTNEGPEEGVYHRPP